MVGVIGAEVKTIGSLFFVRIYTIDMAFKLSPDYRSEQDCPTVGRGLYYDFIEIGTSDHSTITHYCAGDQDSAAWVGGEIWSYLDDLRWAHGLAVDPMGQHLEALPSLPRVRKVEAAVDEWCGQNKFFFVSDDDIKYYMGVFHTRFNTAKWSWPVDVMWYAGSLGSLGKPHPNLNFMLKNVGRPDLLQDKVVQVYDWGSICREYNVRAVDVLQLDCEGRDCAILRGMLRHGKSGGPLPRVIHFEANHLTPEEEVEQTLDGLFAFQYRMRYRTWNNILVERS